MRTPQNKRSKTRDSHERRLGLSSVLACALPSLNKLILAGVSEADLLHWIESAYKESHAIPALRSQSRLFVKAATQLNAAAAALGRLNLNPVRNDSSGDSQTVEPNAALTLNFDEWLGAAAIINAYHLQEPSPVWLALADSLKPSTLPLALRALANILQRVSDAFKSPVGRPAGRRALARQLSALIKRQTGGRRHHREAATLYNALFGTNLDDTGFARFTRPR